jgi:integrase
MASIKKRPNGSWRARYRGPDGKEHAGHFGRKVDAQDWLNEQTASIVTGQYVAPDAGKVTFKAYAETWRGVQVHRRTTAEKVESVLRLHAYPTLGAMELRSILPSHVQAWVKRLSLTLAPSTVAVVHGIVAGVFKSAIRDRRIVASPCEGIKLPEDHKEPVVPLATEQVRALTAALPERFRALVTLAAATGVRQGEALGLTVDRSGLRPPSPRPTLSVDRQLVLLAGEAPYLGPPKRRASRRDLPLPRVAVDALAAHLATFPRRRARSCAATLRARRGRRPSSWSSRPPTVSRSAATPSPACGVPPSWRRACRAQSPTTISGTTSPRC